MADNKPLAHELEILNTLKQMFYEGDVVEIRIMRKYGTVAGYYDYDHFAKCAHDVAMYDEMKDIEAIYYACNPVNMELHSRSYNKLVERAKSTAGDKDIKRRRLLPIDVDPVRPTGTSSNDTLHDRSIAKAYEIKAFLVENGFPDMIIADSGNGAHVDPFIDLPNTEESRVLVENIQKAIIQKFNHPEEDKIDIQGFANAARIWKLYGTKTRKGDEVPEMDISHRRSHIIYKPEKKEITSVDVLKRVADMYIPDGGITPSAPAQNAAPRLQNTNSKFELFAFMEEHGMGIQKTFKQGNKTVHRLDNCPFNPDHTGKDSAVFQWDDGKIGFKCLHHSCADKKWADVRELFAPGHKAMVETKKANACGRDKKEDDETVDKDMPTMDYVRAALDKEHVHGTQLQNITAAEQFLSSFCLELSDTERAYFAESEVMEHFEIENVKFIRKMLSSVKQRLNEAKAAANKEIAIATRITKKAAAKADTIEIEHEYTKLVKVCENGAIKLLYSEIARMLCVKHDVVSYGGAVYIYQDGMYTNGTELVQHEVTVIAKAVNFEDGIKTPTDEVIHYMLHDKAPVDVYPFNLRSDAVNVDNGVVLIDFKKETLKLVDHDPKFKFNYKFDVAFNPDNQNDVIHNEAIKKYVDDIDVPLLYQIPAQGVLEMMGSDPFKKAYILQGDMDAGKSAYLVILLRMFGKSTHSQVSLQDLVTDRFALADLEGKILNVYDDLSNIPLKDAGKFKTITGKHEHRIQHKNYQAYDANLTAVHVYTCNEPPRFDEHIQNDTAFWGRWEYVHFQNHFERDAFFYDRVFTKENLEGFFIKVLEHVIKIRNNGLQVNSTAGEVRQMWSFNADPLYQFISLNMDDTDREITLNKDQFHETYKKWCISTGVDATKMLPSLKSFTIALDKYGFVDRQISTEKFGRTKCYQGAYKWKPESAFRVAAIATKTKQESFS